MSTEFFNRFIQNKILSDSDAQVFRKFSTLKKAECFNYLEKRQDIFPKFLQELRREQIVIEIYLVDDVHRDSSPFSLTYENFRHFLHEELGVRILMLPGFTHVQAALDDITPNMTSRFIDYIHPLLYPQINHLMFHENTGPGLNKLLCSNLRVQRLKIENSVASLRELGIDLISYELILVSSSVDQYPGGLRELTLDNCTIIPEGVPRTVETINIKNTKLDTSFIDSLKSTVLAAIDDTWNPNINIRDCELGDGQSVNSGTTYSGPLTIENLQYTDIFTNYSCRLDY